MPGIYYNSVSRREFVTRTLGTAGLAAAWTTLPFASALAEDEKGTTAPEESKTLRLALLSDTHFPADATEEYRGFKPAENLRKILPRVIASKPEGIIINGDAARLVGLKEDYTGLQKELAEAAKVAPVYIGLGNHDDRDNFNTVFATDNKTRLVPEKHVVVVESGPVNLLLLDSLLYVNKVAGLLGKAQRTWLASYLRKANDKPILLFVHHTLGDGDGDLLDVDRLFQTLKPFPQVKAVFYGHSHVYSFGVRDGKHLVNLPAVGYNFDDSQPVGWVDATFTKDGFSLTLNAIGGNMKGNGKTTKKAWLA